MSKIHLSNEDGDALCGIDDPINLTHKFKKATCKKCLKEKDIVRVHYAMAEGTLCGKYIAVYDENQQIIQHTTIKSQITCRTCLKELKANKDDADNIGWAFNEEYDDEVG